MALVDPQGKLSLVYRPNKDSRPMDGRPVLFGNDLGHAYYLKYQNHGPEYLTPWWTILNWARIAQRYAAAKADALTI